MNQDLVAVLAIPLGIGITVLLEISKLFGIKNPTFLRVAVALLALALALLVTYQSNWYEIAVQFIYTVGTAIAAYELVLKPFGNGK